MEIDMEVKNNKRSFGAVGERIAKDFLEKNNFDILQMNFRVGRMGEIDIIAREKEYLCFVEVKTRRNMTFGMPSEAVNYKKQKKIMNLAYVYLKKNILKDCHVRFDIIEIMYPGQTNQQINLIRNAFGGSA